MQTNNHHTVFWVTQFSDLPHWLHLLQPFTDLCGKHNCGGNNRFAQKDWLQLYCQHLQPHQHLRLCIITQSNDTQAIQAVLLLKQNKGGLQQFLGGLEPIGTIPHITDATEVLLHPDADPQTLIPLLAQALLNAPFSWSYLHWMFTDQAEHMLALAQALAPYVAHSRLDSDLPRPFLTLPPSAEAYIKQRSSRVKKFVNNKQNRLNRDYPDQPFIFKWVDSAEAAQLAERWFFPTYLAYWTGLGVKTPFHRSPYLVDMYIDSLRQGLLKMTGMFVGDSPACVFVGYDLPNSTYLLHLTCFNQQFGAYSPGILHNDACIKDLIEKGYQRLDFGLGDLEYKRYFTKTQHPTMQWKVHRTLGSYMLHKGLTVLKQGVGLLKRGRTEPSPPDEPSTKEAPTD
jgi:hypothetical protein